VKTLVVKVKVVLLLGRGTVVNNNRDEDMILIPLTKLAKELLKSTPQKWLEFVRGVLELLGSVVGDREIVVAAEPDQAAAILAIADNIRGQIRLIIGQRRDGHKYYEYNVE